MASRRGESKQKKINPTLFIFCEGDTEEAYINLLKSEYRIPSIHIHPKVSKNDITSRFIRNFKSDKVTHEKDKDFLFYDLDVPNMLAKLSGIKNCTLLVSNPCVELWFLLHYKNQNSNVNNKYCIKEIKNRNRSYKKGVIDDKLKDKLVSKRKEAIKRAKKLINYNNPSSTVYKLIELLEQLKNL